MNTTPPLPPKSGLLPRKTRTVKGIKLHAAPGYHYCAVKKCKTQISDGGPAICPEHQTEKFQLHQLPRETKKKQWTVQQAITLYETIEALTSKFERENNEKRP
jgi:hypothetical protein